MIRKTLVAAIGLAALGMAPALAADLPARTYSKEPAMVAPVYDWSGFYIGLNGGGASSRECYFLTSVAGVAIAGAPTEGCHDANGVVAGGQVGYRWQSASWVFGVEAQGDWANLRGANASLTALIPYTNQTKIDAFGLFTGQVGYAWNNALLYVKGGAAVTENKYSSFFTAGGVVFNQTTEARWGGTAGVGLEYGFAPNWSVGIEYNHLFMGRSNVTFPVSAIAVTRSDNIGEGVDMGTVRLNYRFGGPIVARY
jgi:outer membrane immunogenic protein